MPTLSLSLRRVVGGLAVAALASGTTPTAQVGGVEFERVRSSGMLGDPAPVPPLGGEPLRARPQILDDDAVPDVIVGPGVDAGLVRVLSGADGRELASGFPFDPAFTGGLRVAAGDITGDGVPDIIVAMGPGGGLVRVFSGADLTHVVSGYPFGPTFVGGVFVAAGDVNGDGRDDVITGQGTGGGQARAYSGIDRTLIGTVSPFGPTYAGGVHVAAGDIDGDGHADLIAGQATGGLVSVLSGADGRVLVSGAPYTPAFDGGVFVAAGDVSGDGRADIIVAPGMGGGPVRVFDGVTHAELARFMAYDAALPGGVRVAASDLTGDGRAEILTAPGAGGQPQVRVFGGAPFGELARLVVYDVSFAGGVFVSTPASAGTVAPAPRVTTTLPADGATAIPVDAALVVTFNTPVTVTPSAFTLECPAGTLVATTTGTASPATAFTLEPAAPLPPNERCVLTVVAGEVAAADDPDNTLPADHVVSFTTGGQPPTAVDDVAATDEDTPITIDVLANDTDPDGDPLTITAATQPPGGSVVINGGESVTYTPALDFNGVDTFTYTVDDGNGGTDTATVTVTVANVNDPPEAADDAVGSNEDTPVTFDPRANDSDADGDALTITAVSTPAHGSAVVNGGISITYTPDVNFNGVDAFTYTIDDGNGGTDTATVTVTVVAVNDPPVASDESFDALGNTALEVAATGSVSPAVFVAGSVLDNDADADASDTLAAMPIVAGASTNGGVFNMAADGTFNYTPPPGDTAPDTFSYELVDGNGGSDTGTVTVNISGVVWYVDNTALGGGNGTSTSRFNTLAAAETESEPGDTIYVFEGDSIDTGQDAGITLKDNQRFVGAGVALTTGGTFNGVDDQELLAAGNRPAISNSGPLADGVTAENVSVEIRGLTLTGEHFGVNVAKTDTGTATVVVTDNVIAGGSGFGAQNSGTGTLDLAFNRNTASSGSSAISIVSVGGPLYITSFADNTVTEAITQDGLRIHGAVFDADPSDPDFAGDQVAAGVTVVGDDLDPTGGSGIVLTNVTGDLAFSDLRVNATGRGLSAVGLGAFNAAAGTGLRITTPATATVTTTAGPALDLTTVDAAVQFSAISTTSSSTAGVSLGDVNGTVSIAGGSIDAPAGTAFAIAGGSAAVTYGGAISTTAAGLAVLIQNRSGGSTTFDGTISQTGGSGIEITGATAASPVTFNGAVTLGTIASRNTGGLAVNNNGQSSIVAFNGGLNIATSGAAGVTAGNGGTLSVSNGQVGVSGGPALDIASTTLAGSGFTSVSSLGSPTTGISLSSVSGTLTMVGGGIGAAGGAAFNVTGGNAAIGYGGLITNTAGPSVSIAGRTGGNVTLSGAINDTGTGILVQNNTGGAVTFSGSTKTVNTGTNAAVQLLGNSGAAIDFTGGGLDIDTTTAIGFTATGGGTVTVGGAGNSINSTGTTALNMNGVIVGTGMVTFQSISSAGSTHGIVLNTVTNAQTDGIQVTGTGTADGSGGTISNKAVRGIEILSTNNVTLRNMTLTSASTTDGAGTCDNLGDNSGCNAAVYMSTANTVVLDNVDISGTTAQYAFNGRNVANFALLNSTATACGDEVNEGCLRMVNATGTSSITGSNLSFPSERAAQFENTAGVLALTVDNSAFRDTQSSGLGADGLELLIRGTSNVTVDVTNSSFLRNRTNGLQVLVEDSGVGSVDVTGSTFDRGTGIGIGMDLSASDTGQLTYNVIGNPLINSNGGPAFNSFADNNAVVRGRVNNNPDIQVGGAGTSGIGIRINANESADMIVQVAGNTVSNIGFDIGIDAVARGLDGVACGTGCTAGRLDVTINDNGVTLAPPDPMLGGGLYDIRTQAQESNTVCANITSNVASAAGIVAYRARTVDANSTLLLQGFNTDATTTWNNNGNTPVGSVSDSHNGTRTGGTCRTVSHPLP